MKELIDVYNMHEIDRFTRINIIKYLGRAINHEYAANVTDAVVYELVLLLDHDNDIRTDPSYLIHLPKDRKEPTIDGASTFEAVAETNELESLRSMREEVQNLCEKLHRDLFRERIDFKNTKEVVMYGLLKEINKVVNPDE